jgi:uncharacterized protein (TIGR00369 family)
VLMYLSIKIVSPSSLRGLLVPSFGRFGLCPQHAPFSNQTTSSVEVDQVRKVNHLRKLIAMYASAPIAGLINDHKLHFENDELSGHASAVIKMTSRKQLEHPGGSMHGAAYFKLLDDAAWFTAQALVEDGFIYTTSFVTYLTRPVVENTNLVARGNIINASKTLIVAEGVLLEENTGKLVASGSGTFMKGQVPLASIGAYRDG